MHWGNEVKPLKERLEEIQAKLDKTVPTDDLMELKRELHDLNAEITVASNKCGDLLRKIESGSCQMREPYRRPY